MEVHHREGICAEASLKKLKSDNLFGKASAVIKTSFTACIFVHKQNRH